MGCGYVDCDRCDRLDPFSIKFLYARGVEAKFREMTSNLSHLSHHVSENNYNLKIV